jgi:hypothetical protein
MSKCNLIIIFTHLYKLLIRMHLDTGDNEIVLSKVLSPNKFKTKTIYYTLSYFNHLKDLKIKDKSKSFLAVFQSIVINKL